MRPDANLIAFGAAKVSFEGDGVLAGFAPGVEQPSWLNVPATQIQAPETSFTLELGAAPTLDLEPGSYETSLRFVTGSLEEETAVTVDLPVALELGPTPAVFDGEVVFEGLSTDATPPGVQPLRLDFGGYDVSFSVALLSGNRRPSDFLSAEVLEGRDGLDVAVTAVQGGGGTRRSWTSTTKDTAPAAHYRSPSATR